MAPGSQWAALLPLFSGARGLWAQPGRLGGPVRWQALPWGGKKLLPRLLGLGLRVTLKQVPLVGQELSPLWLRPHEKPPHRTSLLRQEASSLRV